ncbi:MAG: DUF86 domain-containing protein [Holosporales bacterium]|jgi:uncharacterized protein with HEPN domain|nr:DUF86 domain-containing protein [Holosporales bacterium]
MRCSYEKFANSAGADTKISVKIKNKYPNIPWKDISGFRNILVHDYLEGVDLHMIWNIVSRDLLKLKIAFLKIKNDIE